MNKKHSLIFIFIFLLSACNSKKQTLTQDKGNETSIVNGDTKTLKIATTAEILARKEVPVLCYHQIRDWRVSDGKRAQDDIIAPARFKEHVKMLADSGYHTILPDQLYNYLVYGEKLPEKPIMLTFDDTDLDQFEIAAPTLKKYGFKGVYFIMTVAIGKKGRIAYMNKAQIRQLNDEGNTIANHTYDHKNFAQFTAEDWKIQIEKPNQTLAQITGKKVEYFAYPYGIYKPSSLHQLKAYGIKAAFILSTKRDENYPLFTIRRIIDPGTYTAKNLYNSINKSFNKPKL